MKNHRPFQCKIHKTAPVALQHCRILSCHNYAGSKYGSPEIPNTLPSLVPTEEDIIRAKDIIDAYGLNIT